MDPKRALETIRLFGEEVIPRCREHAETVPEVAARMGQSGIEPTLFAGPRVEPTARPTPTSPIGDPRENRRSPESPGEEEWDVRAPSNSLSTGS